MKAKSHIPPLIALVSAVGNIVAWWLLFSGNGGTALAILGVSLVLAVVAAMATP